MIFIQPSRPGSFGVLGLGVCALLSMANSVPAQARRVDELWKRLIQDALAFYRAGEKLSPRPGFPRHIRRVASEWSRLTRQRTRHNLKPPRR
jgi:hypothetical protein